ncbi:hypothetical protein BDV93DRAFT_521031 [Ceratobasidium sp. AG-I]|nr:hypothetical protein BDV93DRAFT_521031 [Ceratobasidium sp. AG-I]
MARPVSAHPPFENQSQLDRDQASVVNNCWSEGSYELGVEALDAFRTVDKRYPPPSHIRQLLALALYPPEPVAQPHRPKQTQKQPAPSTPTKPGSTRSRPHTTTTSVPAPLSPRKLQEQTEIPSGRASQLALELLSTLSSTTRPVHLVAGLTSYARPACDGDLFDGMVRTGKVDGSKSPLVREAVTVGRARDCWTMLRPGFLTRKILVSSRAKNQDEYDDEEGEDTEEGVVASHAWGVLDWWTRLFEVDQAEHELEQGSAAPPALFLSHIPSGAPQWDVYGALGAALAAYKRELSLSQDDTYVSHKTQSVSNTRGIGFRLLTLLINATRTCAVAPSVLLDQLCTGMGVGEEGVPSSVFKRILADLTEPADFGLGSSPAGSGAGLSSLPADSDLRMELELPKRRLFARFCFCLATLYLARAGEGVPDLGVFGDVERSGTQRPKARPTARIAGGKPTQTEVVASSQPKAQDPYPYPAPALATTLSLLKSTSSQAGVEAITKHAFSRLAIAESLEVEIRFQERNIALVEPWISAKDVPEWRVRTAEGLTAGFVADASAGVEDLASSALWKAARVRSEIMVSYY